MGIIKLFNKKKAVVETPIRRVVVVFNVVSHESLVAAVLYTLTRRELDRTTITLADIRDDIPQEADQYVWIGVKRQSYTEIVTRLYGDVYSADQHRRFLNKLEKASVEIEALNGVNLIEAAMDLLEAANVVPHVQALRRFITPSEQFLTHEAQLESLECYSRTLDMAYRYYQGEHFTLEDFNALAEGTASMKDFWLENQKRINKTATLKMREVSIEGQLLFMLNTTGPEVYFLLRRLCLSRKQWVHVSSGTHGVVVFSSIPIKMDKEKHITHVLQIQPAHALDTKARIWSAAS